MGLQTRVSHPFSIAVKAASSSSALWIIIGSIVIPVVSPPSRILSMKGFAKGSGASCGRRKPRHDHIDFEPHQFRRQFGKAANLSLVRSELEPNVLPLDVTELAQRLGKQPPESLPTGRPTHQNANGWHLRLLRRGGERPTGRHAANQRDEPAPFLIEPHPIPHDEPGRTPGYRIGNDQSAGMPAILQPGQ
jgi:hypothetical protein